MAKSASLCSYCEKISFDALRGPSKADIEDLGNGEPGERFARTAIERQKVGLGTLNRMLRDASSCALYSLFYRIIKRQGAAYQHRSAFKTLESDDIQFRADPDLSWYAKIKTRRRIKQPFFCTSSFEPDGVHCTSCRQSRLELSSSPIWSCTPSL